ncbi:hypothetical protein H8E88_05585 [candidate division KSB1 bacterium]|nr:hypothetical protein [candidate division KSB1 bacterium]
MLSIIRKNCDIGSLSVIFITFVLFAVALFTKGLTHDLLLESAVFLVSVKLIIMSYKNSSAVMTTLKSLDEIHLSLQRLENVESKN